MKTNSGKLYLAITVIFIITLQSLKCQYHNSSQIAQKLEVLGKQYSELCSVKPIIKTLSGNNIWLITIGSGVKDSKPGVAIVGGVDGKYLLGTELAIGFAEKILKNSSEDAVKELLDKITFYILPDVNPDASVQFFSNLKYERDQNSRPIDDDRDFMIDEDPYEDLNKDGLITLIRIKDPAGKYIECEEDKRVMVASDLSKGQTGEYLVYSEGIDNDKDGQFNEDLPGGVNFNHNLTFNYEAFGQNSGPYPVSESETKAVLDFLYDHFNIYTVFSYGPQDNLGQPMKGSERQAPQQAPSQNQFPEQEMMRRERTKITSILKSDEDINKLVSEKYHELTGAKGTPVFSADPGNFMEWAYFHYGRYSFSTPGWWFPVEKGKNNEAAFLKFAEKNNFKDYFVPWTKISHPDFPEKVVEVGGIKPFILYNPPEDTISDLVSSNYKFIMAIAEMHPELQFLDVKVENAGENIFRLTLKVHNKGVFATCAEIGDQNMWTRIMRISLEPSKSQAILSGLKVQRINRLPGDESAEFSWLISGKGRVDITAGAANVGTVKTSVEIN